MKAFQYTVAETTGEATALLGEYGTDAAVLAGGTDLMIELRRPSAKKPKLLLDISRINELDGITETENDIRIGALVSHRRILESNLIRSFAPHLAAASSSVGSPQIRNRGTIGGNVMNAAACADTVPPLIALNASVHLGSAKGRRKMPLAEFFLEPYKTVAQPDEVLIAVRFGKLAPGYRSAFIKLGRRNALAISRLSVAVILKTDSDGRIADARIVPGAAFPTWRRIREAEEMLIGEQPSEKLFAAAGTKVSEVMIGVTGRRWSSEYKEPVLAVLVRRGLAACSLSSADLPEVRRVSSVPVPPGRADGDGTMKDFRKSASGLCAITVTVNDRKHNLTVPSNRTLLTMLREDLGLTGTKCGCEVGECGACTVVLDGEAVNSCLVPAPQVHGRSVTTVEGLMQNGSLHPLQKSFLDHDAAHCGFCTPGMLMSAKALVDEISRPTKQEIRTAISGNLCRCTGYVQIVDAIAQTPEQEAPDIQTPNL